jgi:hypothetical protein
MLLAPSIATLTLADNWALLAGPPSPEEPLRPVPAIRVRMPSALILKTQLSLARRTLPLASTATDVGG